MSTFISTNDYPNLYGTGSIPPTSYPYAILANSGISGSGVIAINNI